MDDLDRIIQERVALGMPELLLAIYDYAYCLGAGIIPPTQFYARHGLTDLLTSLEQIHRTEVLSVRGWEGPPTADALPGWLLSLAQQADVVDPPPVEGWPV